MFLEDCHQNQLVQSDWLAAALTSCFLTVGCACHASMLSYLMYNFPLETFCLYNLCLLSNLLVSENFSLHIVSTYSHLLCPGLSHHCLVTANALAFVVTCGGCRIEYALYFDLVCVP